MGSLFQIKHAASTFRVAVVHALDPTDALRRWLGDMFGDAQYQYTASPYYPSEDL